MRVISGIYKGKKLKGFNQATTRPTSDRVKEALFSMLDVKDKEVLDLFAGSGSLGIEALSRYCKSCYFVEKDNQMFLILKDNLKQIKPTSKLFKGDYLEAFKYFLSLNLKFDLIFLDPPYEQLIINKVLEQIKEYNLLNGDGIVVCEYNMEQINNNNYELIKERTYKNKHLKILKIK